MVVKNLPANGGDTGLVPGLEDPWGVRNGNPISVFLLKTYGQRSLGLMGLQKSQP